MTLFLQTGSTNFLIDYFSTIKPYNFPDLYLARCQIIATKS